MQPELPPLFEWIPGQEGAAFRLTQSHGQVDGAHYSLHVSAVEELKRDGRYDAAGALLELLMDAAEREAEAMANPRWKLAPWYYRQAAIAYRKVKDYESEVRVLARYLEHPNGMSLPDISERRDKAAVLLAKQKSRAG